MAWIDTIKTKRGFDYKIGEVVIARAIWTKVDGTWLVDVGHLGPEEGVIWKTMPLKEVMRYLHDLTAQPQRPL